MSSKAYTIPTVALAVFACFLWSTAFLGIKVGLNYMTPLRLAGYRFFLAGLGVYLFYRPKGFVKEVLSHKKVVFQVAFFQTFCLYALFFSALSVMSASTGAIISGAGPLVTALMAHFLMHNERLSKQKIFCFILGFVGILIVTLSKGSQGGNGSSELLGIFLMGLSVFCSSFASILVAKSSQGLRTPVLTSSQLMLGGLALLVVSLFKEPLYQVPQEPLFYLGLLWLIFVTAGGFSIWFYLIKGRGEKVSVLSLWKFIIPILGAILSWSIIREDSPSPSAFIGMVLTGLAILFYYLPERRKRDKS